MSAKELIKRRPEWLTKELLAEHEIPPIELQEKLVNTATNQRVEGESWWARGKFLQWHHAEGDRIPLKAEYEVACGYWSYLREQIVATPSTTKEHSTTP